MKPKLITVYCNESNIKLRQRLRRNELLARAGKPIEPARTYQYMAVKTIKVKQ